MGGAGGGGVGRPGEGGVGAIGMGLVGSVTGTMGRWSDGSLTAFEELPEVRLGEPPPATSNRFGRRALLSFSVRIVIENSTVPLPLYTLILDVISKRSRQHKMLINKFPATYRAGNVR